MFTKKFRYHILEKDYPTWFRLSRASNQLYAKYPNITYQQHPTRKIGGDMVIEETVSYSSKEESLRIEAEMKLNPEAHTLSDEFLKIVSGEIHQEEMDA